MFECFLFCRMAVSVIVSGFPESILGLIMGVCWCDYSMKTPPQVGAGVLHFLLIIVFNIFGVTVFKQINGLSCDK